MKTWMVLPLILMVSALVAGCGGGGSPTDSEQVMPRGGEMIAPEQVMAALTADLAELGKPAPDFLNPEAGAVNPAQVGDGEVSPMAYMTGLTLGWLLRSQSVSSGRVQWYEFNVTNRLALTDVVVFPVSGDPDLYVFSPLRPDPAKPSLKLVGYSIRTYGNDQVGSFKANDWGGPGRFIAAVYGYNSAQFHLKAW